MDESLKYFAHAKQMKQKSHVFLLFFYYSDKLLIIGLSNYMEKLKKIRTNFLKF